MWTCSILAYPFAYACADMDIHTCIYVHICTYARLCFGTLLYNHKLLHAACTPLVTASYLSPPSVVPTLPTLSECGEAAFRLAASSGMLASSSRRQGLVQEV